MYTTTRTLNGKFYVNIVKDNGDVDNFGDHPYNHKRSARTAAKLKALSQQIAYRQDLEYGDQDNNNFASPQAIPEVASV